jgi:hypothetical protein
MLHHQIDEIGNTIDDEKWRRGLTLRAQNEVSSNCRDELVDGENVNNHFPTAVFNWHLTVH